MKLSPELEAKCLALARPAVCAPAPPPRFASETDFQAWIIRLARSRGWRVYHTFDSRRSEKGFPDLVLVRDGVQVVAELKFGTGKPTAEQKAWLAAFKLVTGVRVYLWYETDAAEIEKVLA